MKDYHPIRIEGTQAAKLNGLAANRPRYCLTLPLPGIGPNATLMRLRWRLAQFFEIRWWRNYLGGKDAAQYLHNKRLYWQRIMASLAQTVQVKSGDTIVDMGCGPSGLYLVFPDNPFTAVDPLLDQYEQQLEIFSKGSYPNTRFITSAIESFDTKEKFDYVFCMNAINHVSDIAAGFRKLTSLCKPNGKVIVTIDAHNHSWLKAIFRIGPGDVLHPHQYDKAEYIRFLTDNGFKVVQEVTTHRHFIFNHYMLVAVPA